MTPPTVSVVTPTHNRANSLARVLDALSRQTYPAERLESIVVADGCTDGTAETLWARRDPFRLRIVAQSAQGPAASRNCALDLASGQLCLFLDDDVIPSRGLVAEHVRRHSAASNLVVIGPLLPPDRGVSAWVRWEGRTLRRQYMAMTTGAWEPSPRQFYTGNASVRTEHVRHVGGFNTAYRRAEDVELAFRLQRAGLRFVFHPQASGVHEADRPFGAWLAAAYEYGRADVAMGPIWGSKGLVEQKAQEVWRRNPLIRHLVLAGLTTNFPARPPADERRPPPWLRPLLGFEPVAWPLLSALFEIAYWRGVESAVEGRHAIEIIAGGRAAAASAFVGSRPQ